MFAKIRDRGFDKVLEGILANGTLEKQERVGEVVGVAVGSDVGKPVPTAVA